MGNIYLLPSEPTLYRVDNGPVPAGEMAAEHLQAPPMPKCQAKGCTRSADGTTVHGTFDDPTKPDDDYDLLPRGVLAGGPTVAQLVPNREYKTCFIHRHSPKSAF